MTGPEPQDAEPTTTRRIVLRSVAVVGIGVPLLAACGGDDEPAAGSGDRASSTPPETTSEGSPEPSSPSASSEAPSPTESADEPQPKPVTTTSAVPVGGGVILSKDQVIVTQPTKGQFRGFVPNCTHQGCPLDNVKGGTINCICHGSMFSVEDGSVQGGPAPSPLPEKPIVVAGNQVLLAE